MEMATDTVFRCALFSHLHAFLLRLNIGQELEPRPLTPHWVDRIGANVRVLGEVAAGSSLLLPLCMSESRVKQVSCPNGS